MIMMVFMMMVMIIIIILITILMMVMMLLIMMMILIMLMSHYPHHFLALCLQVVGLRGLSLYLVDLLVVNIHISSQYIFFCENQKGVKNPGYGRQRISRPMRMVPPIFCFRWRQIRGGSELQKPR